MEEQIIYVKRFIKTEDDLPKQVGSYFVKLKRGDARLLHFPFDGDVGYNIFKKDWMDSVDHWLQPTTLAELIKEKLPSENDTIGESLRLKEGNEGCNAEWRGGFTTGARYVINKLTE